MTKKDELLDELLKGVKNPDDLFGKVTCPPWLAYKCNPTLAELYQYPYIYDTPWP